jgi:hypothetical protein
VRQIIFHSGQFGKHEIPQAERQGAYPSQGHESRKLLRIMENARFSLRISHIDSMAKAWLIMNNLRLPISVGVWFQFRHRGLDINS